MAQQRGEEGGFGPHAVGVQQRRPHRGQPQGIAAAAVKQKPASAAARLLPVLVDAPGDHAGARNHHQAVGRAHATDQRGQRVVFHPQRQVRPRGPGRRGDALSAGGLVHAGQGQSQRGRAFRPHLGLPRGFFYGRAHRAPGGIPSGHVGVARSGKPFAEQTPLGIHDHGMGFGTAAVHSDDKFGHEGYSG